MNKIQSDYHGTRLSYDAKRSVLWETLCSSYFQKFVNVDDTVLELGAGYGDFINNISSEKRIAVDIWDGFGEYISSEVETHVASVTELSFLENKSVNFVFASNIFEHLKKPVLIKCLNKLKKKLKVGATINILQPNYRYAFREYFDDYTHEAIYSDIALADLLESLNFKIVEVHPKFLPLTIKSRFPVMPILIKMYLKSPYKPMGKQMFIRAKWMG
jgi:hypothetical protein